MQRALIQQEYRTMYSEDLSRRISSELSGHHKACKILEEFFILLNNKSNYKANCSDILNLAVDSDSSQVIINTSYFDKC